jgi:dihydrolipoamide dehydrogenase
MGARLVGIAATIHAHPTRGKAFQEAEMNAFGHDLDI